MLFHSLDFLTFFLIVGGLFYLIPGRFRWVLLLIASYYFYSRLDLHFLILIASTTGSAYLTALGIERSRSATNRKVWLILNLVVNLGLLGFFKYFNFLNESVRTIATALGLEYAVPVLNLLLPIGISFYTFQAIGYTVDVYRGEQPAEKHPGILALFIAFFPQLLAGPIGRSTRLLPQFCSQVPWNHARITSGLSLMLFGFFKKLVIADRLALYVNEVYDHPGAHHGLPVILATYFFSFQIYCDFSGYSDIAIGSARVLGVDLMNNFDRPYFATSVQNFWKRWHISLSSWFRDYLYLPLGGSRCSTPRWSFNILVVFLLSGLWHGANWTFVVWGAIHGILLIMAHLLDPLRRGICGRIFRGRLAFARARDVVGRFYVFQLIAATWLFFRANTIRDAALLVKNALDLPPVLGDLALKGFSVYELKIACASILALLLLDLVQAKARRPACSPARRWW